MCVYIACVIIWYVLVSVYSFMQSALMVDPHPGTEEDQMCIGLALVEVGHLDETGSHYSLVPLCYISTEWLFTPSERRSSSTF